MVWQHGPGWPDWPHDQMFEVSDLALKSMSPRRVHHQQRLFELSGSLKQTWNAVFKTQLNSPIDSLSQHFHDKIILNVNIQ